MKRLRAMTAYLRIIRRVISLVGLVLMKSVLPSHCPWHGLPLVLMKSVLPSHCPWHGLPLAGSSAAWLKTPIQTSHRFRSMVMRWMI
jgi:hypothetical protein